MAVRVERGVAGPGEGMGAMWLIRQFGAWRENVGKGFRGGCAK